MKKTILVIINLALFTIIASAAPGDLDSTFDGNGKVITSVVGNNDFGYATAIDANGKIVVAGYANDGSGNDFTVVRYNTDGSLDTTFDGDGIALTDLSDSDVAYAVAIDANGKIVIAGYSFGSGTGQDFTVVRYNTDGSLDTTFNGDGIVTTPISTSTDIARSVAIDAGGKIVVGGYAIFNGNSDFATVRYNADGSLDTTFGSEGIVTTDFDGSDALTGKSKMKNFGSPGGTISNDVAYGVAIDSIGRIVLAGRTDFDLANNFDVALVRYNTDGSLDTTFDSDGKIITTVGTGNDQANDVAIDAVGRIVIAGNTGSDSLLVRYNSNGSLDTSFDSDGIVINDFGSFDNAVSLAIDLNGQIVAAIDVAANFVVGKYNADGSLDTSFGSDGVATADFTPTSSPNSIAVDQSNRIVVAGYSTSSSALASDNSSLRSNLGSGNPNNFAVARFENTAPPVTPTSALDPTFDGDGKVITSLSAVGEDGANDVIIDPTGKIIAVGNAYNGANDDFAVVRYNADGSLDTSFGGGDGIVFTDFASDRDRAEGVALDANGKIVVAGTAFTGTFDVAIARYNTDGSLDTTFGTGGKVTTSVGSVDFANSVVVDANGKIVIGGYADLPGGDDFLLIRYNDDGILDTTFDTDGIVTTDVGSAINVGRDVAIDANGKIVFAGNSTDLGGVGNIYGNVLRYNTDGSLDTTFDTDGIVTFDTTADEDTFYGVAMDSNNKIVVAGQTRPVSDRYFLVVRFNTDGSLDTTFDGDGVVTTQFGMSNDNGRDVAIDGNDKIIAAGFTFSSSDSDFAVARYNTDGSLDTTFSGDGKETTDFASSSDTAAAVAIDAANRIVVAGVTEADASATLAGSKSATANLGTTPSNFALARYGQLAPTAASVSISGRVLTSAVGRGVPNAIVHTTDQEGNIRIVWTNMFGYYRFDDVEVGQKLIANVYHRRYQFNTQVITVNDSLTNLNFIAQ